MDVMDVVELVAHIDVDLCALVALTGCLVGNGIELEGVTKTQCERGKGV